MAKVASGGFELGEVLLLGSTAKAIRVHFLTFEAESAWIPRSQVHPDSEVPLSRRGLLILKEAWLAEKIGLYKNGYVVFERVQSAWWEALRDGSEQPTGTDSDS